MSIYITNMDIPKDEAVALYIYPDGRVKLWRPQAAVSHEYEAVPVLPHGRLIDGDELYASLKKWLIQNRHSMTEATRVWIRGVLEGIAAAPTIIPAEEGEA